MRGLQSAKDQLSGRQLELTDALKRMEEERDRLVSSIAAQKSEIDRLGRQLATESEKLAAANRTIQSQAEQLEVRSICVCACVVCVCVCVLPRSHPWLSPKLPWHMCLCHSIWPRASK